MQYNTFTPTYSIGGQKNRNKFGTTYILTGGQKNRKSFGTYILTGWQKMGCLHCITVEPVLFTYMLLIFMEMTTIQDLVFTKVCLERLQPQNISDCAQKSGNLTDITNETTTWLKYCNGCLNFFTLLSSFYAASWCDTLSRKTVMIIPLIGTIIASSVNLVLSMFINLSISYLFISATISGLSFGTVGICSACFGYLTDIIPEESRTKRIVILEAMIFSGGTIGFYLVGAILKNTDIVTHYNDFAKAFAWEIALASITTLYVMIKIPSTSNTISSETMSPRSLFSIKHLQHAFRSVFKSRFDGKRKTILLLMLALMCLAFGLAVQLSLTFVYAKRDPLKWDITTYSNYNAVLYAVEGAAMLLGLPVLFHFLHVSDPIIAIIGAVSRAAGLILLGLSHTNAMMFSCCAAFVFSEYSVPAVRSMLSKQVDENERGSIFAFVSVLQNLCFFLASLILMTIFEATSSIFPGLCFEIVAAMQGLAIAIFIYLYFSQKFFVTRYEIMENGSVVEVHDK